jgi:hypothetical protein
VDRRAATRLVALGVVAGGALAVAVHLDRPGATADLASGRSAVVARTAGPTAIPPHVPPQIPMGARTALERGLAPPARAVVAVADGAPVDESLPHRHVVDPETGGLVSLAGTDRTFPDAQHLGPLHEDPLPPDASLDDPTDTASLLEKAGDVEAGRTGDRPFEAAATAPVGTPTLTTLSQHVSPSCSGTGDDGNRVQPLYVHEASTPSRFADVLPILRNAVANVDDVFAVSAQQTGGERRVRWVHDADCLPVVKSVTVPDGSIGDSFMDTVDAVKALGYTKASRKYLMFTDADKLCGIASVYDDPSLTGNANNGRYASYARVDSTCWSTRTSVPAHELTHTLGGVLGTAPHATKNGHCFDDHDLMCYDDGSGVAMQTVCASAQEQLLDCNHDDYFSTRPAAGSFLAKNWNTASSSFLDTVVNDVPPPTVTVTSSASAAQTGDRVTFTATSPQTVGWTWSRSANGASCTLTPSSATAALVCPSTVVGDVVVTATATQTGASGTGSGAATVALTKAAAPTATLSVPGTAEAGDPVPVSVTAVGKAPFGYAWSASPCTVAAPASASTSLTCAAGTPTQDVPVAVVVTQADGQTVRSSATLHLDAGASAPGPAVGTVWGSPTLRSGVIGSVLRTASGAPLARRAVTLQAQWFGTGSWVDVRQLTTDATGLASAATAYDRAGSFRFASAADSGHQAAQSTSVFVKVGTRASASKPSRWRVAGVLASTTGQRLTGQTVELQRRRAGTSAWVTAVRLTTSTQGTVSRGVRPRHRTYYRWVFRGTGERVAATSGSVRVR